MSVFAKDQIFKIISITAIFLTFAGCGGGGDNKDKDKDKKNEQTTSYSVSFNSTGGSSVTARSVKEGESVSEPSPAPTRNGYDFDGWYFGNGTFQSKVNFPYYPTGNITLYAKWKPHVYTLTIYYDESIPEQTTNIEHGNMIPEPIPTPTREGYDFSGWFINPERTTSAIFPITVTGHVNLYVKWNVKKFNVTINSGVGGPVSEVMEYGDIIEEPSQPEREGYNFDGWFINPERTIPADFPITVTGHVNLYVRWMDVPWVTSIQISPVEIKLDPEQTITLDVTYEGVGDFKKSVIWQSSDISIANVNKDGLVTAVRSSDEVVIITAAWSENTDVKASAEVYVPFPVQSALRAIPIAADPSGKKPVVVDSFTYGGQNYFLIDVGQIGNTYISDVIPPIYSNGKSDVSQSKITLTEQAITNTVTETVSNSITMTNSSGESDSIGFALEAKLGVVLDHGKFGVSFNHTWNKSFSQSETNSRTLQTSVSDAIKTAETQSATLTVKSTDPVGCHRVAMYAPSNIYFVVTTTIDNLEVLGWETVAAVTSSFFLRQEFAEAPDEVCNGVFDNAPLVDKIDFADDFYRYLTVNDNTKVFDFSNSVPNQPSTAIIAKDVQRAVFIGQNNKGIIFNNYNIVVSDGREYPLTIEFENFGMSAPIDTAAIKSTNTFDITMTLRGYNRILGGSGITAANEGQRGNDGRAAIDIRGRLTITGGGSAHIEGGSGSNGKMGISYPTEAKENKSTGLSGGQGGRGGDGGNSVIAADLAIFAAIDSVTIKGGSGATGGNGGYGEGTNGPGRANAGAGGSAGNGGDGGHGVVLQGNFSLNLKSIQSLQILGGNGGSGGIGGTGGRGYESASVTADHGGDGGSGGIGGKGGGGIFFENASGLASGSMELDIATIQGGSGGNGGNGGTGGKSGGDSNKGIGGSGGNGGNGGSALRINTSPSVLLTRLASSGGNGGLIGSDGTGGKNKTNSNKSGTNGSPGSLTKWEIW